MSYNYHYAAYPTGSTYYQAQPSTQSSSSYGQSPYGQSSYDAPAPYRTSPAMSHSLSSQSNSSSGSTYTASLGTISPSQLYISNPYEPSNYVQSAAEIYGVTPSTSGMKVSSSKSEKSYPCLEPGCSSAAKGSKFTRAADLDRHLKTVHYPIYIDCPFGWCGRTGKGGFSRKDHLNEHLKQMHMGVPVPPKKR